jgi:zinc protease
MRSKLLLLLFFWISLLLPPVLTAQYDESGALITITPENSTPLVYKLPNGLTVVLHSDRSQPQVTGMVVVKAGGKNDLPEATGMAHYMEHMLFKGTTKIGTTNWEAESRHINRIFELYDSLGITTDPVRRKEIQGRINQESVKANEYAIPNELDKILKEIGSTGINAGTGPDYTVYFNNFPSNQMERWLEVYSHRFLSPVFRSFQAELEVVYEEKNMYSDMFFMNLLEEFNKKFFKVHPYGQQPLIGTIEHLKNPSLTKMKEFYDRWYVANNMALIITGDFEIEAILPLINQKFGALPAGKVPEKTTWVEAPFSGREFVEMKLSPIKLGLLGFRMPPSGHPDDLVIEVMMSLLANSNGTGLLDKLSIENKLLQAAAFNMPYLDYGAGIVLFVPKVVGQSLGDAEKMVLDQLAALRSGNFSDTLLESVKLNLYRDKVMALESSERLAYEFMGAFTAGIPFQKIWEDPQRIRSISKDQIIMAATEYFGSDFLAFHSKMGFPKKEKIDKPGYEPVVKKNDEESTYYRMIQEMGEHPAEYRFVDFDHDIQKYFSDHGYTIYRVGNPKNDIFSLDIKYGIGEGHMPILQYVSQMMNLSGAGEFDQNAFRLQMAMLGCNYSIRSDDSYFTITLTGLEENLEPALKLLNTLVQNPVLEQSKLSVLYSGERAGRKMERSEPDMIADALLEYVLYGEESTYLNRLTLKEIKGLKADTLVAAFHRATRYTPEIHFVGKRSADELAWLLASGFQLPSDPLKSLAPYYRAPKVFLTNEVYVAHKKKAAQSKIFFHATLEEYNPRTIALYNAFNTYFGGDFSGIVLQEVREYRSMAYSAGAGLRQPPMKGHRIVLSGFVGTQADKTNEAVDLFNDLVRTMPQKPERIGMIKRYIAASTVTRRPGFRSLSQAYVSWLHKGYDRDPSAIILESVEQLESTDIFDYQKKHMANTPLTIMIAGNAKRFDQKDLAKHGKVITIKEKQLFSK